MVLSENETENRNTPVESSGEISLHDPFCRIPSGCKPRAGCIELPPDETICEELWISWYVESCWVASPQFPGVEDYCVTCSSYFSYKCYFFYHDGFMAVWSFICIGIHHRSSYFTAQGFTQSPLWSSKHLTVESRLVWLFRYLNPNTESRAITMWHDRVLCSYSFLKLIFIDL